MSDLERRQRLRRGIERTATIMDTAVRIPVLGIRIGLDAVLGLVPGLGDAAGLSVSAGYLVAAARAGAPRVLLARMLANIAVDFVAGFVPVVGDLFDIAWKANHRNAKLVVAWAEAPVAQERASRRLVVAVVGVVVLMMAAAFAAGAWLAIRFVTWVF